MNQEPETRNQKPPEITVIAGDCLEELRKLPAGSVHCCVTSPPYWGLRDYNIPPSIWAAAGRNIQHPTPNTQHPMEEECAHEWGEHVHRHEDHGDQGETSQLEGAKTHVQTRLGKITTAFCAKCGAWRGCLGLEPTPELFVAHLVAVFAEVRRVLRKDGTLWLNLGDCYATGAGSGSVMGGGKQGEAFGAPAKGYKGARNGYEGKHTYKGSAPQNKPETLNQKPETNPPGYGPAQQPNRLPIAGRKPGDLVGIPWLVALALQADGWWLRQANIWHKPACMPESLNGVRWERCRVKVASSKRAPVTQKKGEGNEDSRNGQKPHGAPLARDAMGNAAFTSSAEYVDCAGCKKCTPHDGYVLRRGAWRHTTAHEYVFQFSKSAEYFCDAMAAQEPVSSLKPSGNKQRKFRVDHGGNPALSNSHKGFGVPWYPNGTGRNPRSVWRVNTKPFKGAHFATFPPDLIRPILRAACPERCCAACGAPWAPVVERDEGGRMKDEVAAWKRACGADAQGEYYGRSTKNHAAHGVQDASAVKARILAGLGTKRVTGLRPTCRCPGNSDGPKHSGRPGVALDPFFGSGTTGMVCQELGRDCIGIELAAHYHPLIAERLAERKKVPRAKLRAPRKGTTTVPEPVQQPELFAA